MWKKHPKALPFLFFSEMWERFGYYLMIGIFTLYLKDSMDGFNMDEAEASSLTSVGNDCDYDQVFEKQVQALGRPGDVLLGISTSGNSRNVVRAVDAANALGLHTIGLLGGTGGVLQGKVALPLTVTCTGHTPRVQEGHLLMYHLICERLEEILENKA